MDFNLQDIWTAAGASAAALVIGYIFGFVQSAAPFLTNSGTLRNYVLIVISAGLVLLAGATSGHTLSDPNAVANVFGGFLVFLGLYNAAKNAHGAGEATALKTVDSATAISSPPTPLG